MEKGLWLSIACAVCDSIAYVWYNIEFWKGRSKPNRVTWGLWSYIAILNATSYLVASHDLVKTIVALENAAMCVFTFVFVLFRGQTEKLKPWEWATAAFGFLAATAWIASRNAFNANSLLQIGTVVSFVPLSIGLWKNPRLERSGPWGLWTAIYCFLLVVVIMRWRGNWHDLVYPVNYVFLHAVVFVLAIRRKTEK